MVATVPTEVTVPGVLWPLGSVMLTLSPTASSPSWSASRSMVTMRFVDVAVRICEPGWAEPPRTAFVPRPGDARRGGEEDDLPEGQGPVLGDAERRLELLDPFLGVRR